MGHASPLEKSTVGPKDIYTLEALSHFNREKIPERAVHALGAGAYGEFEVCSASNSMQSKFDSY